MADQKTPKSAPEAAPTAQPETAPQTSSPISELAQAIVLAMKEGNSELAHAIVTAQQAAAPPRQLTIDEVDCKTTFNPKGVRNRELPFKVFQNGVPLRASTTHDAELALLPRLKSGQFINGLVEVIVKEIGGTKVVHVNHNDATPDQRIALKNECRNLTEILQRCVEEAEAAPLVTIR